MSWINLLRWVHILAAAAWLGEVVTVNLVLVPLLARMPAAERGRFIALVFPRVFRLASLLSATTLVAGLALNYAMTGWRQLDGLLAGRWGQALLAGGALGLLLTLFHFFAESRLEPKAKALHEQPDADEMARMLRRLQIIPRVGLGVLLVVFALMMYAARGL